jgi:hypothetical protein
LLQYETSRADVAGDSALNYGSAMSDKSADAVRVRMARYHNPYIVLEWEEDALMTAQAGRGRKESYYERLQEPAAYYDLFGSPDHLVETTVAECKNQGRTFQGDSFVSRDGLEDLLSQVLSLYKPYVAKSHWTRVMEFRPQFLLEATRTQTLAQRTARRLEELKFSLMPGEKIEYNRASADQIIKALTGLLK